MTRNNSKYNQLALASLASAVAAVASLITGQTALAGTQLTPQPTSGVGSGLNAPIAGNSNGNNYAIISLSGSTALRNYTKSAGLTYLPSDTDIFLSSGSFFNTATNGNAIQLAPGSTAANKTGSASDAPALEIQWHEQGATEGVLELVTDQVGPLATAPPSLVNRSPIATNPVWINGNSFGTTNLNPSADNGWLIDNFVNAPGTPNALQQSPVQIGISDVKVVQAFSYTTSLPNAPAAAPGTPAWALKGGQAGYGMGNPALPLGSNNAGLGIANAREQLQNQTNVNMPTTVNDPATGQPYAAGPWNTAGVNNLNSVTVGIAATTLSANPGTGLAGVNQNDAQWLEMTSRLQNGATFDMTTRDVNSGTHNTFANNIGIDPSWAVGVNDNGSTLATSGVGLQATDAQYQIGEDANGNPTIRYSGKTSGSLLADAVANSRMAIGTLVLSDALGKNQANSANPIRILTYNPNGSDQTPSNFILPTAATIISGAYVPWQQEQYVTVKAPNTAFGSLTAAQWASTTDAQTGIKGDTANQSVALTANIVNGSDQISGGQVSGGGFVVGQVVTSAAFPTGTTVTGITYNSDGTVNNVALSNNATGATGTINDLKVAGGDVANFRANILNADAIAGTTTGYASVLDPGDALLAQNFILPAFMAVQKPYDGAAQTPNTPFNINTNPTGYNQALSQEFLSTNVPGGQAYNFNPYEATHSISPLPNADSAITTPTNNDGYYGQAVRSASTTTTGGTIVPAGTNVAFVNGNIAITSSNYLFGNFNNNGIRDFSSFETGIAALAALYNSGYGVDANSSAAATGNPSDSNILSAVVLNAAEPGLAGILGPGSGFVGQQGPLGGTGIGTTAPFVNGVTKGDLIVIGDYDANGRFDGRDIYAMAIGTALSDNLSVTTLSSEDAVRTGVLRKNAALDYAQAFTSDGSAASAFIRMTAAAQLSGSSVPSGATQLYSSGSGSSTVYTYTFDPTGANAFNKSDVLRAGTVDLNDAFIVDNSNGLSYTNLANTLAATAPAPVTGTPQPLNLVLVQQVDGESSIGAADVAVVNTALTGTGNSNLYGYNIQKTGPSTVTFARTGGTVTVYSGASVEVSGGSLDISGSIDPFSDNTVGTATSGNHAALAVDHGASVVLNQSVTVSGLTIDLSTPSKVDIGSSNLTVDFTGADPAATIRTYLHQGYAGGVWTGAGLTSSTVAAQVAGVRAAGSGGVYGIGYVDGSKDTNQAPAALVHATGNQIVYTPALIGDANLDGSVTFIDLGIVAQNLGAINTDWQHGDFNYDGTTNFLDIGLLAQNLNKNELNTPLSTLVPDASPALTAEWNLAVAEIEANSATTSVPEPGTISLLAVGAAGLLARRRKAAR